MKLIYNHNDRKYIEAITHHFLQTRKGEIMSGHKAQAFFRKVYGLDIDYHDWAYTLDYMTRIDEAELSCFTPEGIEYLIK